MLLLNAKGQNHDVKATFENNNAMSTVLRMHKHFQQCSMKPKEITSVAILEVMVEL